MGQVENDAGRLPEREKSRARRAAIYRGDRVRVAIARIELFVSDLDPLDRLIALNECLRSAIDDGAGVR